MTTLTAPTQLSVIDRARLYIKAVPPAVSGNGGHDTTFSVACALVNGFALTSHDATNLLREYSATCFPPWSEKELEHKIRSAAMATHANPRGHLIGEGSTSTYSPNSTKSATVATTQTVSKKYDSSKRHPIPTPMADAARRLLLAAFEPGETIAMADAIEDASDKRSKPKNAGSTDSREGWIALLDDNDGDPNKIFTEQTCGAFIRINPMSPGGKSDGDVTQFRHALVEFDSISIEDQYSVIKQSNVPCSAVLHSGGKSIHAWVRIDAKDRAEYDSRVAWLYEHFSASGIDIKNKNPSRFSRLAGMNRGDCLQNLLEVSCGSSSWQQWQTEKESESLGELVTVADILNYDPTADTNSLLGQRWLCKGGSCIWVGQSGIGKSSLSVQAAFEWGMCLDFFGVKPTISRPLKSLIIQAENDLGDVAEMVQGVMGSIQKKIEPLTAQQQKWHIQLGLENVKFVRNQVHTGMTFCQTLGKLIDIHKPDIVWVDPLLAFFGEDISNQKACSQFLRNWINPILEATGVVLMLMHHTNKPAADSKAKSGWTRNDYSYAGTGSAELTNWARAVIVLRQHDDDTFRLAFTKRGKRAGAVDMDGGISQDIFLEHAKEGIAWNQVSEPEKEESGRPKKDIDFEALKREIGDKKLKWWEIVEIAISSFGISKRTCDRNKKEITAQLVYDKRLSTYSAK